MNEIVKNQILAVRNTGKTNMFDTNSVQIIADKMQLFELVVFIEENPKEYRNFIMFSK